MNDQMCSKCKDLDCRRESWFLLPPGHLVCSMPCEDELPEMECKQIECEGRWQIDPRPYYDSDEDCVVQNDVKCITVIQHPHSMYLYDSNRVKSIVSRNRKYSQTMSTERGLTGDAVTQIHQLKKDWAIVCPHLQPPRSCPVFPEGYDFGWLVSSDNGMLFPKTQ